MIGASKFKWTKRQTEKAKFIYSHLSDKNKRTAKRIAAANGCQPWEFVADSLCGVNHIPRLDYSHQAKTVIETRRDRWYRRVAERLAINVKCNRKNKEKLLFIPQEYLEEIECCPIEDVITDRICFERGYMAKHLTAEQKHKRSIDDDYDKESTRTRNLHEKEVAESMVFSYTHMNPLIEDKQLHNFMRIFYRKGDCGLDNAISRAIKFSVKAKGKFN